MDIRNAHSEIERGMLAHAVEATVPELTPWVRPMLRTMGWLTWTTDGRRQERQLDHPIAKARPLRMAEAGHNRLLPRRCQRGGNTTRRILGEIHIHRRNGNDWPGRTQTLRVHSIWPTATPRPTASPGITSPHSQTRSPMPSPGAAGRCFRRRHNDTHRQPRRVNSSSTTDPVCPIACYSSVTLDYRRSSRWLCSDTRSRVARHFLHEHAAFHHEHRETWIILPLEPHVHFCTPTTLRRQPINAFSSPHDLKGWTECHSWQTPSADTTDHPPTWRTAPRAGLGVGEYSRLLIRTSTLKHCTPWHSKSIDAHYPRGAWRVLTNTYFSLWQATAGPQPSFCHVEVQEQGLLQFHAEFHARRWTIKRLL